MQQAIDNAQGPIHAKLNIPGSQSITFRAMLLAALADGVSEINGMRINDYTHTFINALYQLGIVSQLDEATHSCIVAGGNGRFPKKQATIWCADSLTVTRFLLSACAATPGVYYFDGSPHLRSKSIIGLLSLLCRQGVQLIPNDVTKLPFTLVGEDTLEGGDITFEEDVSSQIISALLMIAPYARSAFSFTVTNKNPQPYIDITSAMMAEFGVLVHRIHQGQLMVPVPQRYQSRDYYVEPDFSIAAYFFGAAAITQGEMTIQAVKRTQSKQPAVKFLSILEKMGCQVIETHAGLTLKGPTALQGVEISLPYFSNFCLALIAIAPFAKSVVRISFKRPLKKANLKRMLAMKTSLSQLQIDMQFNADWIEVHPSSPKGGLISAHHDSYIAMAISLIGLKIPDIVIDDIETVIKENPEFFTLWKQLVEQTNINA